MSRDQVLFITKTRNHSVEGRGFCDESTGFNYNLFFCKYIHIIHRNTQIQYKQTFICTHKYKCLHCARIERATFCVVGEYTHHYAKSAI
jgi:hypothetical protein